MNIRHVLLLLVCMCSSVMAKDYSVSSPDGRIAVVVKSGEAIAITVQYQGQTLVQIPRLQLYYENSETPAARQLPSLSRGGAGVGSTGSASRCKRSVIKEEIDAPFYRQKHFAMEGRQLDMKLHGGFGLQLRVYDEGVAYRFYSTRKGETIIRQEENVLEFPEDSKAWLAYTTNAEKPFAMAFQNTYHETPLQEAKALPAFLPATMQIGMPGTPKNPVGDAFPVTPKVTLLESDLRSYPGMFVKAEGNKLEATFAPYPKKMDYYRWRGMSYVSETEDYIAKSSGPRTYPWRILAITTDDTQMPVNNLVYALATPNQIGDTSWLKPGKVAWDWWHDWNLKGVDFVAGINTRTYLYYIDFAAKYHLPYVVLDEGWYDSSKGDIMNAIPAIDLQRLIDYGREKGVGIVLWTVFNVLDEHRQEACEKYARMGIKGFKIDFLDRNDQNAVEMAERLAKTCADHRLFVDYHGFYAPTGMSRTYPNILNYEGVFGMEECRWAKKTTDMPRYDVTFPFIRMMAGQVDFTPGAMHNGTRENWVECYQNPVSMGTRCHQAACYVVHDSPFTMLCDAPTTYEQEPAYTRFIAQIPDEWDETRVLQGHLGEYIVTARRKGDTWYVAGQTNWNERTIQLPLSFLNEGKSTPAKDISYSLTLLTDGINAHHHAEDYRFCKEQHPSSDTLTLKMASGGGFIFKSQTSNLKSQTK